MLESQIERKLVDAVRARGGLCLKWVCPGRSGVPDRICLLPGGRIVFIELKRPDGGRIAPLQHWWAKELQRLGFEHRFIKSEEDIKEVIK